MSTCCILWLGGHTVVGDQVTVPSPQAVLALPPAGWPWSASVGTANATAATAATPNAVRLLSFTNPPEGDLLVPSPSRRLGRPRVSLSLRRPPPRDREVVRRSR